MAGLNAVPLECFIYCNYNIKWLLLGTTGIGVCDRWNIYRPPPKRWREQIDTLHFQLRTRTYYLLALTSRGSVSERGRQTTSFTIDSQEPWNNNRFEIIQFIFFFCIKSYKTVLNFAILHQTLKKDCVLTYQFERKVESTKNNFFSTTRENVKTTSRCSAGAHL